MSYVKNITLSFREEFNAFCVSDQIVNHAVGNGFVPFIRLRKEHYIALCGKTTEDAPLIGFLLGREKGFYSIDYNYAKAIVQSGVNIRFLTYENVAEQMKDLCGLILPGGAFSSPDDFYADEQRQKLYEPNPRYEAYETAIRTAEKQNMPILGICAGAQMIAGLHGMRLWRDIQGKTHLQHKNKNAAAHIVYIKPETVLRHLLDTKTIITNSRHKEAVVPKSASSSSDLQIYALANDGIPEAWGNEEKNILCIQWHPEDFAAHGNQPMQNIYNWLAQKAEDCRAGL